MNCAEVLAMTSLQHDSWLAAWSESVEFASPFLHPAYARAVARAGLAVTIGMDADLRGFLPLQRTGVARGGAVGGRLADFSGAIWPEKLPFEGQLLLRACGMRHWVLRNCVGVVAHACDSYAELHAPFIDLSQGVDGWLQALRQRGGTTFRQLLRKRRKLTREVGVLRLERCGSNAELLALLLSWKNRQRRSTGSFDLFQEKWARILAADLMGLSEDGFYGALDVLYAGDELLAIHLGLGTHDRLHWWVPAYNQKFANYSPGMVMLLELARNTVERGIFRIDLGPGDERYKLNLSTGATPVRKVALHRNPIERSLYRVQEQARHRLRGTALGDALKTAGRAAWRRADGALAGRS